MSGPDVVRIKRKRTEHAPEALLVERPGKRQQTDDQHYVLQKDAPNGLSDAANVPRQIEPADSQLAYQTQVPTSGDGLDGVPKGKRVFHLKRSSTPEARVRKRKHKDDGIATFVEKHARKTRQELLDLAPQESSDHHLPAVEEPPLKRPGKGAAITARSVNGGIAGTAGSSRSREHIKTDPRVEAMAQTLHQFAMEEAAKDAVRKPKITSLPKLPPQRSHELHRQRTARLDVRTNDLSTTSDMDIDEEADYVYDTYVLAPSSRVGAAQIDAQGGLGSVGYLVITEDDEDVWEAYVEDEPSEPSDEDDENAEDWYGADYPDDELASDDEFDRNPYHYRAHDSDQEWEESATFSDEEYERQTQPWRKRSAQHLSKYFSGVEDDLQK